MQVACDSSADVVDSRADVVVSCAEVVDSVADITCTDTASRDGGDTPCRQVIVERLRALIGRNRAARRAKQVAKEKRETLTRLALSAVWPGVSLIHPQHLAPSKRHADFSPSDITGSEPPTKRHRPTQSQFDLSQSFQNLTAPPVLPPFESFGIPAIFPSTYSSPSGRTLACLTYLVITLGVCVSGRNGRFLDYLPVLFIVLNAFAAPSGFFSFPTHCFECFRRAFWIVFLSYSLF